MASHFAVQRALAVPTGLPRQLSGVRPVLMVGTYAREEGRALHLLLAIGGGVKANELEKLLKCLLAVLMGWELATLSLPVGTAAALNELEEGTVRL